MLQPLSDWTAAQRLDCPVPDPSPDPIHLSDPPPVPPVAPDPGECCGEGCANCILDIYDAALERYESELAAWRQRHTAGNQG